MRAAAIAVVHVAERRVPVLIEGKRQKSEHAAATSDLREHPRARAQIARAARLPCPLALPLAFPLALPTCPSYSPFLLALLHTGMTQGHANKERNPVSQRISAGCSRCRCRGPRPGRRTRRSRSRCSRTARCSSRTAGPVGRRHPESVGSVTVHIGQSRKPPLSIRV